MKKENERKRDYAYIVVPLDQYTNEAIVLTLAQTCAATGNEKIFLFNEKEKRGYIIPHEFVTRLKRGTDHRLKFELYEQEGGGKIRKYGIPLKKVSAKIREAKRRLKEVTGK